MVPLHDQAAVDQQAAFWAEEWRTQDTYLPLPPIAPDQHVLVPLTGADLREAAEKWVDDVCFSPLRGSPNHSIARYAVYSLRLLRAPMDEEVHPPRGDGHYPQPPQPPPSDEEPARPPPGLGGPTQQDSWRQFFA